jgi:predicted nucleic-acid-binding protein
MKSMKGIDTNVLVRYIVQDNPAQSKQANQFIKNSTMTEENVIFIPAIVLCELVWVLESCYGYQKQDIITVLEKILKTQQFCIKPLEVLWNALRDYQQLNIDFADSYIAHINAFHECEYTATCDKKAARLKYFKQL